MRIILIDNRDSFTFNLFQQVRSLGAECVVIPNTGTSLSDIKKLKPDSIIISPGPGRPEDSAISLDVVRFFTGKIPILGVCLGHQILSILFGLHQGSVPHAPVPVHGKTSLIHHTGNSIFKNIPNPFKAARYHSLIVDELPENFELLAWTGTKNKPELIMGMRHNEYPVFGVQFHPESFLTEHGDVLMQNFLSQKL